MLGGFEIDVLQIRDPSSSPAELYVNDASDTDLTAADKFPVSSLDAEFYELETGRHVPPDRVVGMAVR